MNLIKPRTDVREVINENTGKVGGYQIHHWNGRVDAVIRPPHLRFKWRATAFETHDSGLLVPAQK